MPHTQKLLLLALLVSMAAGALFHFETTGVKEVDSASFREFIFGSERITALYLYSRLRFLRHQATQKPRARQRVEKSRAGLQRLPDPRSCRPVRNRPRKKHQRGEPAHGLDLLRQLEHQQREVLRRIQGRKHHRVSLQRSFERTPETRLQNPTQGIHAFRKKRRPDRTEFRPKPFRLALHLGLEVHQGRLSLLCGRLDSRSRSFRFGKSCRTSSETKWSSPRSTASTTCLSAEGTASLACRPSSSSRRTALRTRNPCSMKAARQACPRPSKH